MILPGDKVECIFPGPWAWMNEDANFLVSEDNQRTQAVWLIGVHVAK
jgi:hypothetical protein